jgi:hypothetical protein
VVTKLPCLPSPLDLAAALALLVPVGACPLAPAEALPVLAGAVPVVRPARLAPAEAHPAPAEEALVVRPLHPITSGCPTALFTIVVFAVRRPSARWSWYAPARRQGWPRRS